MYILLIENHQWSEHPQCGQEIRDYLGGLFVGDLLVCSLLGGGCASKVVEELVQGVFLHLGGSGDSCLVVCIVWENQVTHVSLGRGGSSLAGVTVSLCIPCFLVAISLFEQEGFEFL